MQRTPHPSMEITKIQGLAYIIKPKKSWSLVWLGLVKKFNNIIQLSGLYLVEDYFTMPRPLSKSFVFIKIQCRIFSKMIIKKWSKLYEFTEDASLKS